MSSTNHHNLNQPTKHLLPDSLKQGEFNNTILVNGIEISWDTEKGQCFFRGLPVAMMWVDTTLANVMSGVAAMVGHERFNLALQAEGRKSVESDWLLISAYPQFHEGFNALNLNAAIAGWGDWQLIEYNLENRRCVFRAYNNWEGLYQHALGVCWGSGMLAGKFSGICSKLFNTNCWATQTTFVAKGAAYDEFIVSPSSMILEDEIEKLLLSDQATRADMAVAMQKLRDREHQLHQANADLTRFAEVSAHHLMEPTRRLTSYTQRLQQQIAKLALDSEQTEQLNSSFSYLQADANRLHTMIHDIQLYLAASEPRGEMPLHSGENVNSVIAQLQARYLANSLLVNTKLIVQDLPPALLDRPRLLDLFSILIDNAIHHGQPTDPNTVAQIQIQGERYANLSRYRISDNGAGIAKAYQERVFGIFERLGYNNSTGSGIGLAIAKRIVESRNGRIWIEDTPETGTCVVFELPDGDR